MCQLQLHRHPHIVRQECHVRNNKWEECMDMHIHSVQIWDRTYQCSNQQWNSTRWWTCCPNKRRRIPLCNQILMNEQMRCAWTCACIDSMFNWEGSNNILLKTVIIGLEKQASPWWQWLVRPVPFSGFTRLSGFPWAFRCPKCRPLLLLCQVCQSQWKSRSSHDKLNSSKPRQNKFNIRRTMVCRSEELEGTHKYHKTNCCLHQKAHASVVKMHSCIVPSTHSTISERSSHWCNNNTHKWKGYSNHDAIELPRKRFHVEIMNPLPETMERQQKYRERNSCTKSLMWNRLWAIVPIVETQHPRMKAELTLNGCGWPAQPINNEDGKFCPEAWLWPLSPCGLFTGASLHEP